MIDLGKQNVLGIGINAVDYDDAVEKIVTAAKEHRPFAVSALAVHGVMTGALDAVHRYRLNKFDLVVPDGQPVRWALKWLHRVDLPDRVYGPELTLRVCERAAREGLSVYLYGSQLKVIEKLRETLPKRFPGLVIAGSQPSRYRKLSVGEQMDIIEAIKESRASFVLVGLGCPRQEIWTFEHRDMLSIPLLAVGAAFDFHAGMVKQAPRWLQQRGLEWFYRLVQEPRRLWKRYAVTNVLYLLYVAMQFARLRTRELEDGIPPIADTRLG